ncbi:MAG: hypothetical protein QOH47_2377 [Sphingomonadales bacterium]|jgi:hypothetical protein|nr:hypothetical protein [Sphingomonadales bacterium]
MNQAVTKEAIHAQARGESASQATVIEQSRAIAEVQGALVVAQQRPRDETRALATALESCRTKEVAETAFFKFPRGGQTVSGETIHLAVELARCWGNVAYGIVELSRNDRAAESEMMAFAWDLQTNTRSTMGFIVPHKRDKRGGPETLTDMRDIYENNANMGARRLRECIFRVLPPYLKEQAKAACYKTLQGGSDEKPLAVRLTEMADAFAAINVSRERIEAKLGPIAKLTPTDLANLIVSYRSINRNEVSADEEFPRVGVEEATAAARKLVAQPKPGAAETVSDESPNAEEGRADVDRGEGFTGADESDEHPARRVADEIIKAAGIQGNVIDLANLKAARSADMAAMPDEMAADVNRAFDAAELKLRKGKE